MKKIARWALAFSAVMSIQGSAMAFVETAWTVTSSKGYQDVHLGTWLSMYVKEADGMVYGCEHKVKWMSSPGANYRMSTNLHLLEYPDARNFSCDELAYEVSTSLLYVNPDPALVSYGFTHSMQKAKIFHLVLTCDEYGPVCHGLMRYSPMGFNYKISAKPM